MPAIGKITLDVKEYEALLAKIQKQTESAGRKMQNSMTNAGKGVQTLTDKAKASAESISKAGGAVSALGSSVGASLGAAGQSIAALAAGPVGILTAAIGGIITAAKAMWEALTVNSEDAAAALTIHANKLAAERKELDATDIAAKSYLDTLREFDKEESLSIDARKITIGIVNKLTEAYGYLGAEIDKTTGKVMNFSRLEQRLAQKQAEERAYLLERESRNAESAAKISFMTGIGDRWFTTESGARMNWVGAYSNDRRLEMIDREMQKSKGSAFQLQELEKARQLLVIAIEKSRQAESLLNTGFATDLEKLSAEIAAETEKKQEQKKAEAAAQQMIAAKNVKMDAERKAAESREEAERQKQQKFAVSLAEKDLTLYEQAALLADPSKRAKIELDRELRKAEREKGSVLTDAEREQITRRMNFAAMLSGLGDPLAGITGNFSGIRTNSLTARGGMMGGAAIPRTEQIQQNILDKVNNYESKLTTINTNLAKIVS